LKKKETEKSRKDLQSWEDWNEDIQRRRRKLEKVKEEEETEEEKIICFEGKKRLSLSFSSFTSLA